jgi:hypothetical protein
MSVRLSIRLFTRSSAATTGHISVKFVIGKFHQKNKISKKFGFGQNRTKMSNILNKDLVAAGDINLP